MHIYYTYDKIGFTLLFVFEIEILRSMLYTYKNISIHLNLVHPQQK